MCDHLYVRFIFGTLPYLPHKHKYEVSIPLDEQQSQRLQCMYPVQYGPCSTCPPHFALGFMHSFIHVGLPLLLDHVSHSDMFVLVISVVLGGGPSPFFFFVKEKNRGGVVVVEAWILQRVVMRCALCGVCIAGPRKKEQAGPG